MGQSGGWRGGRRVDTAGTEPFSRRWFSCATAFLAPFWLACPGTVDGEGRFRIESPSFGELFELRDRVELQESDSLLVTGIASLDVDESGRILVPAPAAGEVRLFDREGRFVARLGRPGDGPGEFRRPANAAFGRGGVVYVSDNGSPRITRFTPELRFDTTFTLSGAYFGGALDDVPNGFVVFAMRSGPDARLFDVYDSIGSLKARFHPIHPLIRSTPGWLSAARSRLVVGGGSIFVADNMIYPIRRYRVPGGAGDGIGTPPASWRPASRPERGTFGGADAWSRFARWRRTFTTVSALGIYRDSLLLVAHRSLDPRVIAYEEASYRLDIYRLGSAVVKVCEDVPLPGAFLHSGEAVYLLLGGPPNLNGWTLGRYQLREGVCR